MGEGDEVGDEEEDAVGPILVPLDHWQRHKIDAFKPNELSKQINPTNYFVKLLVYYL